MNNEYFLKKFILKFDEIFNKRKNKNGNISIIKIKANGEVDFFTEKVCKNCKGKGVITIIDKFGNNFTSRCLSCDYIGKQKTTPPKNLINDFIEELVIEKILYKISEGFGIELLQKYRTNIINDIFIEKQFLTNMYTIAKHCEGNIDTFIKQTKENYVLYLNYRLNI